MEVFMKKRLIVLFNNKLPDDLIGSDIIFAYNVKCLPAKPISNRVIFYNLWEASKDKAPSEKIHEILGGYKDDVAIIANTMYSNLFSPIYSFFKQLSSIISTYDIGTVLLSGGSSYSYITFEKGEGEGVPYRYKHEWLYNPFIAQYLSKTSVGIDWRDKSHIKLGYVIHHVIRENALRFLDFLKELYNTRKNAENTDDILRSVDRSKYDAIAFASLEGQYNFLKNLTVRGDLRFLFITPRNYDKDCLKLKGYQSVSELIGNIRSCFNLSKGKLEQSIFIEEYNLSISKNALKRAIRTEYFIYKNSIGRLTSIGRSIFDRNLKAVVTCTSQGRSMVRYTEMAKKFNIKHINFQYVTLGQRYFPILELADEYYVFEKGSYDFYKDKSSIFKFYIPQLSDVVPLECRKRVMVIYTQPDSYTEKYLSLLNKIGEHKEQLDYDIIVKLHYRQDHIEEFCQICCRFGMKMIKDEMSIRELMCNSDLSISMTSSVLSESLFYRVPAIIYIEDPALQDFVLNSNIGYPDVNFIADNFQSMLDLLSSNIWGKYGDRLNTFLKNNSGIPIESILKKKEF